MIRDVIEKCVPHSNHVMETTIRRLVPVRIADGGVLRITNNYEDYDFVQPMLKFQSSDFVVDNILAIGAVDMLKPTFISSISSMDFADQFQNIELPKPV